jgi:hypothetical protein
MTAAQRKSNQIRDLKVLNSISAQLFSSAVDRDDSFKFRLASTVEFEYFYLPACIPGLIKGINIRDFYLQPII